MRILSFILTVLLCLSLVSCGGRRQSAYEMLSSVTAGLEELPQGVIYVASAEMGEEGYLSPTVAEALWGDDADEGFSMLSDYAIYMSSFAAPYEIGVFCCYSATDARRIEELCRARADIVRVALKQTEFYYLCGNLRIVRKGRTVIFLMTSQPEKAVRLARRLT